MECQIKIQVQIVPKDFEIIPNIIIFFQYYDPVCQFYAVST